jgi:hypothetical protein
MSTHKKLLTQILSGNSDANISFDDLCNLLLFPGFEMRTKGGHHIFRKEGIEEKINIQKDGHEAKIYQIKQIRIIITKYKLGIQ